MANYPKELTDLVEEYLTDGIISTKERQVLLKKAVALGVDADEFDLYIDAQQQKADQVVDAAASKKRGKTCPFCGGVVPQLTDKCPHCGETITAEASEELQEIFDHLEEALVDFKSGKDIAKSKAIVERYVRKAKMYYENNPKVQKLLAEVQAESIKAEQLAERQAKQEKYKNKWFWVLVECVVFSLLFGIATYMKSAAADRFEDLYAKQMAHPEERHLTEAHSIEFRQIIADKNKAYDESKSFANYIIFIVGAVVIGYTVKLARDDSRKK